MHIHEASANAYCSALAQSITRDAHSFDHWFMLHGDFPAMDAGEWAGFRSQLIHTMREKFAGVSVDILLPDQPAMFLISRDLDPKSLGNLACIMGIKEFSVYELCGQSEDAVKLLSRRGDSGTSQEVIAPPPYERIDYPEIATLSEVFASARLKRYSRQPMHVLLVEDDALTVRMVSGLMQQRHAVFVARDAEDAIAQYMIHAPNIVFLDIGLPGTNGFEVLRHLRAIDPQVFVVMFSGNRDLEHICHALNMGASGFIGKPFRKETLQYYLSACADKFNYPH